MFCFIRRVLYVTIILVVAVLCPICGAQTSINIQQVDGRIEVSIGEEFFTAFNYRETEKPFLYPVFASGQIRMTRDFPMKSTAGESDDHPHHKSVWIGHEINGVDFWKCRNGEKIIVEDPQINADDNSIVANGSWVDGDGKVICRDETKWSFGSDEQSRWIDCKLTLKASESDITIDDTKEGLVALRTHPDLRLKPAPKRGVKEVFGSATNSIGSQGSQIWGEAAAWVLYSGNVDSKPASLLLLDHPDNFRHPTTWHARDYGLVTANPFGLHYFQRLAKDAGEVRLLKSQGLTLQYRFQFFNAIVDAEVAEESWQDWAQPSRKTSPAQ